MPDVALNIASGSDAELVLGFRHGDGEADIRALATADSGRLELYREVTR